MTAAMHSLPGILDEVLNDLRAKYQVGEKHPVPVEDIVEAEGGRVIRRFMIADASLSYLKRGRGFRITVNSAQAEVRQRFSIGHELGHVVLDRAQQKSVQGSQAHSCEVVPEMDHMDLERSCNRFSAGLLIPDEVAAWLSDWGVLTIEGLRESAQRWAVSLPALAWHVLEEVPGDGGMISIGYANHETHGRGARLEVDWSVFPKNSRIFVKPGLAVVSTASLQRMFASHTEELFANTVVPLPGFQEERNVRAMSTQGRLLLLVSPSAGSW